MKKHLYKYNGHGKTTVTVAGCGGTGSQMLISLARMDLALRNLGGEGLSVTAYDPDTVSSANAGRQSFYSCDIGRNKAEVLAERLRLCFPAFEITGIGKPFVKDSLFGQFLITCVDSREARRKIFAARRSNYHMDCGNGANHGQVILGNGQDLPWPEEVLPELTAKGREDNTPSCSMAEALEKQDLFVNDFAVRIASAILWDLFRHGGTDIRGAFYSLDPIRVNPIQIQNKR